MPAVIRIDFDVHAEAISQALQAELAKINGIAEQVNQAFGKHKPPPIVPPDAPEQIRSLSELRKKAEDEIAQTRAAFTAKAWGDEKTAASAIVGEIKKINEQKYINEHILLDKSLSDKERKQIQSEQKELARQRKLMGSIALQNTEIAQKGAGADVGIMGQQRNIEQYKKGFQGAGQIAAVAAIGVGVFNKQIGEFLGQGAQAVSTAAMLATGVGGVAKGLLSAEKAQQLLNLAMKAAPWVLAATAIVGVVAALSGLLDKEDAAAEAMKKHLTIQKEHVRTMKELVDEYEAFDQQLEFAANADATRYLELKNMRAQDLKDRQADQVWKRVLTDEEIDLKMQGLKATLVMTGNEIHARKNAKETLLKDTGITREAQKKAKKEEAKDLDEHVKLWNEVEAARKKREDEEQAKLLARTQFAADVLESAKKGAQNQIKEDQKLTASALHEQAVRTASEQESEAFAAEIVFNIKREGLQKQADLLKAFPEEHQKVLDQIHELERAHEVEKAKIQAKAAKDKEEADKKAAELAAKNFKDQVDAYASIGKSILDLIGFLNDLSDVEHKRDQAADERLEKQMAAHEAMSEANAGLAKDEKEAQAIRKKGEEQRAAMMRQRDAEEDAAAEKEAAQAAKQNTLNLLQAASAMAMAIANYSASTAATSGPLALALIPAGITMLMAMFASAKSGLGFEKGGFTGRGRNDEPAGVVHKNEFVLPANSFARDSQGRIIHIDPRYLGGGDTPSESIRMGSFINLTGDRGQAAAESIRMGSFINLHEDIKKQNDLLREVRDLLRVSAQRNSGRRSRLMLQRSLNRESV